VETSWMEMEYIGYADGTFVPFRNLTNREQWHYIYFGDEKKVREALCFLQKLGKTEGGCTIYRIEKVCRDPNLKRNHYIWGLKAEYNKSDQDVFVRAVENRFVCLGGEGAGKGPSSHSCSHGFCD
jgi:hypothetical protein